MEQKKTLFDYLYQNLIHQIKTGYLPYGAALPSISQLCQSYNVGIRTVRDVLDKLRDEGFIHSEERKASRVIYRPSPSDQGCDAISSVLSQKDSVMDVYETMAVLMPPLFAFSARACSDKSMDCLFSPLERASNKDSVSLWRICSSILHGLLESSGNLLFCDIYTSLELHTRMPFFLNRHEAMASINEYADPKNILTLMNTLKLRNDEEIVRGFSMAYRSVAGSIDKYLDTLSQSCGSKPESRESTYFWNPGKGRDHYYVQITRDLIDKIGTGIYKNASFLPSEGELAEQYGVSVSTVRQAISSLNQLGFTKTYNVKGTQVTLFNDQATHDCMKIRVYKQDTLIYLSGLQFMAAAIKPAALLAFPHIDEKKMLSLAEDARRPGAIPLDSIVKCIISLTELPPLQLILSEVSKLLHWGYYFSFFNTWEYDSAALNRISLDALASLQAGDADGFARLLSLSYCHAFEMIRNFMAGCGLPEAGRLPTPDMWT